MIIAGASGFVGTALGALATQRGWHVKTLVRRAPKNETEIYWHPSARLLAASDIAGADAIVCLSGAPIAGGVWTAHRREVIETSRTATAGLLSETIAKLPKDQRPAVFVCGSAVGFYGDRGAQCLDEEAAPGRGFLAEVCRKWEAASAPAAACGVRTVNIRTGNILDIGGGLLGMLAPAYRYHAGALLGDGSQYFATIWLGDHVRAILHAIECDELAGPLNLVAPQVQPFRCFHSELQTQLQVRSPLVVPAGVLRLFGAMGEELLLASQRVVPTALEASGFEFDAPSVHEQVRRALAGPYQAVAAN